MMRLTKAIGINRHTGVGRYLEICKTPAFPLRQGFGGQVAEVTRSREQRHTGACQYP